MSVKDDLGAGAGIGRGERGGGGAVGDAFLHCPQNALMVGRGLRNIGEGIEPHYSAAACQALRLFGALLQNDVAIHIAGGGRRATFMPRVRE